MTHVNKTYAVIWSTKVMQFLKIPNLYTLKLENRFKQLLLVFVNFNSIPIYFENKLIITNTITFKVYEVIRKSIQY